MNREHVESSNIESVGYDVESRELEVEFKTGAVYSYSDVPPEVAEGLLNAESVGRYFAAHVKGVYAYERVG